MTWHIGGKCVRVHKARTWLPDCLRPAWILAWLMVSSECASGFRFSSHMYYLAAEIVCRRSNPPSGVFERNHVFP